MDKKASKSTKNKKRNTVMKITLSRIAIAVLLIPIYSIFGAIPTAVAAFIGYLTDFLDGYLSRKWGVQTILGKIMDPIGDKAITGILYAILATILSPIFLVPIGLEIITSLASVAISSAYNNKVESTKIGKFKMFAISAAGLVPMALSQDGEISEKTITNLVVHLGVVQLAGVGSYLWQNRKQINAKKEEGLNSKADLDEITPEELERLGLIKDIQLAKGYLELLQKDYGSFKLEMQKLYDIEYSSSNRDLPLISNLETYTDSETGRSFSKGEVLKKIKENRQ